jgi:hypothetical protein
MIVKQQVMFTVETVEILDEKSPELLLAPDVLPDFEEWLMLKAIELGRGNHSERYETEDGYIDVYFKVYANLM